MAQPRKSRGYVERRSPFVLSTETVLRSAADGDLRLAELQILRSASAIDREVGGNHLLILGRRAPAVERSVRLVR